MVDIKRIVVQEILMRAIALKDKYTEERNAKAFWVCVFSQSNEEYGELLEATKKLGDVFEEGYNGVKFLLKEPLGGSVKILKVRKPDPQRKERGDADFSVSDYESFKKSCLGKENFKLIPRDNFEMIELKELGSSVIAYFSDPPIEEQYKGIIKVN